MSSEPKDVKIVFKVQEKLMKMFTYNYDVSTRYQPDKEIAIMDYSNIMMVTALSDLGKSILNPFTDTNYEKKEPTLNFEKTGEATFDSTKIKMFIDILTLFNDKYIVLISGDSMPLVLKNEHLKFILAPRN